MDMEKFARHQSLQEIMDERVWGVTTTHRKSWLSDVCGAVYTVVSTVVQLILFGLLATALTGRFQ